MHQERAQKNVIRAGCGQPANMEQIPCNTTTRGNLGDMLPHNKLWRYAQPPHNLAYIEFTTNTLQCILSNSNLGRALRTVVNLLDRDSAIFHVPLLVADLSNKVTLGFDHDQPTTEISQGLR